MLLRRGCPPLGWRNSSAVIPGLASQQSQTAMHLLETICCLQRWMGWCDQCQAPLAHHQSRCILLVAGDGGKQFARCNHPCYPMCKSVRWEHIMTNTISIEMLPAMITAREHPHKRNNRTAQEPNWNRQLEASEPLFQEPKSEPEPSEPFFRNRSRNRAIPLNSTETDRKLFVQRTRQNRKPEPLEPFHVQTVTGSNRTGATLKQGSDSSCKSTAGDLWAVVKETRTCINF